MDHSLFKDKLLPKVDEENYTFDSNPDGSINYNKVIDKRNIDRKLPVKIIIRDLVKNLPYDSDKEIYTIFYQEACQYVHVDVMSAKSYFSKYDPYDEIEPSLIANLISVILSMLLLRQISKNEDTQSLYKRDASYLCKKLSKRFSKCLDIAKCDPEHPNVIFDILLNRLQEYK